MTTTPIEKIVAEMLSGLDTATIIDRARNSLEIPPKEASADEVTITDSVQAALVNELLAQAQSTQAVIKAATADYEAIKELLSELLGDREVLKVHNAPVFTYKKTTSRILDQSYVKSLHPDIEGNEDFYKTTESRRRLFV